MSLRQFMSLRPLTRALTAVKNGVAHGWTESARALGLQEGAAVAVRPLPDAPPAVSVTVEPASEDDWEIVQLNGGFIEETLLTQVQGPVPGLG